jgi:putative N6-adenine-specific DNA methylase
MLRSVSAPLRIFCACAPGIEPLLADEVRALGAEPSELAGGVELDGDLATVYRANLELGLALRVTVRLGSFRARRWSELIDGAAALPWADWLPAGARPPIKATASKSRLYHTGGIAQRILTAIGEPTGEPSGPAVQVRLVRDQCVISLDTTGELLPRRGYRLATGKAPLRADLARALVIASGWDRRSPLADPFCGAGTILIEAGLLAAGAAPGRHRSFAFEAAPCFDRALWDRLCADADGRAAPDAVPPLLGSDRDAGAVDAATANAARAGVPVSLACAPLSAAPVFTDPPAAGVVACNPPYGHRVRGGRDLRPLYQRLGALCRELGWPVAMVVADRRLAEATGLALRTALMTDHGGRKVYLAISE